MIELNYETIVLVDIDQTLVIWHKSHKKPGKNKVLFVDPYTKEKLYLTPHHVHIRLMKQYKARGFGIVVHSMAGTKWAKSVINKLKLAKYVDIVMSKATRHMDDKEDAKDIIGTRVYLNNDIEVL